MANWTIWNVQMTREEYDYLQRQFYAAKSAALDRGERLTKRTWALGNLLKGMPLKKDVSSDRENDDTVRSTVVE